MRIPGIPGGSEPSFRTRDCQWMGLDTLVLETCEQLDGEDWDLSPHVVKAAIQVARWVVEELEDEGVEELVEAVCQRLRCRRVLLSHGHVQAILTAYARVISSLDIAEINELGT